MTPEENNNEELNQEELLEDFIKYIDDKFTYIENMCASVPDSVVVFKYTFPFGWDPRAITQVVQQSEIYLTKKLDKTVAIITVMSNSEDMNIELIIPKSIREEINELKEEIKKLSDRLTPLEKVKNEDIEE